MMSEATRPSAVDTVGAPSGDALLDQALLGGTARDWVALLKPRVMSLVVFSGAAGLLVAPVPLNPILAVAVIISIAAGSGASGAINMWYDRDIDLIMRRTARRPIPSGRISPEGALTFGVGLALLSVLMMWFASNLLAASILALSILFYVFIYTIWLKRRTPQNIVIGGAAGAFPPIIGWAAATGSISALPLLMFALIFFWTPPHFWSLALFASEDYQRAGVPMMPVAKGARRTRWEILVYTAMLLPISVAPWYLGLAGPLYLVAALGLSLAFLWYAVAVLRDKQDSFGVSLTRDAPAKAAFKYSLIYLFALLGAMVIDHWIG
jgi:protoheme IX farnesyltransferase